MSQRQGTVLPETVDDNSGGDCKKRGSNNIMCLHIFSQSF